MLLLQATNKSLSYRIKCRVEREVGVWSLDWQGEVLRMRLGSPPKVDYLQEGDKQALSMCIRRNLRVHKFCITFA